MNEIVANCLRTLQMTAFDRPAAEKQAAVQVEMDDEAEYTKLKGDAKAQADELVRQAEGVPELVKRAIVAQAKLDKAYLDALMDAGFVQTEAAAIVAARGTTFLAR